MISLVLKQYMQQYVNFSRRTQVCVTYCRFPTNNFHIYCDRISICIFRAIGPNSNHTVIVVDMIKNVTFNFFVHSIQ
jgi:hypothetical protein